MSSVSDMEKFQKMTIPQLREELSKKGIAADPKMKKAALVDKLIESILKAEEDAILNLNASGDADISDAVTTPNEDILNEDVLGEELSSKNNDAVPDLKISSSSEKKEAKVLTYIDRESSTKTPVSAPTATDCDTSADAKLKRAQRFGLPIGVTDNTAKAKRAERFGVPVGTVATSGGAGGIDAVAKAKRAERFGLTNVNSVVKTLDEDAKKKLLIRAQRWGELFVNQVIFYPKKSFYIFPPMVCSRFGLPVSGDGKTASTPSNGANEKNAKLIARAKRFGGEIGNGNDDSELEKRKKARLERFGASN
uniref:Tho1_MOS11_C domain-containing protein n=1 Tax=Heterorhabditis bacteriophora TaxID=37862 RepID=A0A1I7XPU3_HETBA